MAELVYFVKDLLAVWNESTDWLLTMEIPEYVAVFWAFLVLEVPRYLLTSLFVLVRFILDKASHRSTHQVSPTPLVSVILPALNEERTIAHTVRSVLDQRYPSLEIIVVDDGSTDRTALICQALADQRLITYFRFAERQGKSAALNYGARASTGEYLIFMDTDSTLEGNAIFNLVRRFEDERVGAVSGELAVRNADLNLVTRLQAIEYFVSMSLGRRFRASAGILSIVPGAFGAFRRSVFEQVGGHEPGPGNDSDLTIRTRKVGRQISYAGDATCRTDVPSTWTGLIKQRMRWDRNLIRNRVRKHRDVFNVFQPNFRLSNAISFVDSVGFGVLLPVMWLVYLFRTTAQYPDRFQVILFVNFAMHLIVKLIEFVIALAISERRWEHLSLIVYLPVFGVYRPVLKLVRIAATLQEALFRWSYRDPFAPAKVRKQMQVY